MPLPQSLETRLTLASLCITIAAAVTLTFITVPPASAGERNTKSSKKPSSRIKIQNIRSGSEETPSERDRRLYRECQGRPNSGACAGYAHQAQRR